MDNSSGVGVLDKAAIVLGALEAGPSTLAQLVSATGLARPTAHRLAVGFGLAVQAEQFRHRRAVNIRVEHADLPADVGAGDGLLLSVEDAAGDLADAGVQGDDEFAGNAGGDCAGGGIATCGGADGTTPGAQLRTDLFVETLADAVRRQPE